MNVRMEMGMGEMSAIKGPWYPEEDTILSRLVDKFGARNWSCVAIGIHGQSEKNMLPSLV